MNLDNLIARLNEVRNDYPHATPTVEISRNNDDTDHLIVKVHGYEVEDIEIEG